VIDGETWGQVPSSWPKWYTEETANPMTPWVHLISGNWMELVKQPLVQFSGKHKTEETLQHLAAQICEVLLR
jgi:hypothetical protein